MTCPTRTPAPALLCDETRLSFETGDLFPTEAYTALMTPCRETSRVCETTCFFETRWASFGFYCQGTFVFLHYPGARLESRPQETCRC